MGLHLRSEGFRHLHPWPGLASLLTRSGSVRSLGHLHDVVAASSTCASFDFSHQWCEKYSNQWLEKVGF